jgi:predicted metal-dependent phosphoesterase TrpH
MQIDLHTHTTASDGRLSPLALLERAERAQLSLLAITDHDTVAGYLTARAHYSAAANMPRPVLLSGIEMSAQWQSAPVHVLGLGIDVDHPALDKAIQALTAVRSDRNQRIADKLTGRGLANAMAGALAQAGDGQLGRPHFARYMVDQGFVADDNEAFNRYLGLGKPCYARAQWPEVEQVVAWIRAAGGVAVLAHPLKYKLTASKLKRLLAVFREAGGTGLEVVSGRQVPAEVAQLLRLAEQFDFAISGGSDFHGDLPYHPGLGVLLPLRRGQQPIWTSLGLPAET